MSTNIKFTENLIKGKIAEIVFENMLREAGCFTILHFGYEYILPELARGTDFDKESETAKAVRSAPDFAVINNETKKVHLIEVKYRKIVRTTDILKIAERMSEAWNPSYIFLASKTGFYFDSIQNIIKHKGKIKPLVHKNIPSRLQEKYLKLLNKMEK
tara:strand:+ start:300 stop:773 length:474 start_codon:yes stop_codon:yes gene_type:complete